MLGIHSPRRTPAASSLEKAKREMLEGACQGKSVQTSPEERKQTL